MQHAQSVFLLLALRSRGHTACFRFFFVARTSVAEPAPPSTSRFSALAAAYALRRFARYALRRFASCLCSMWNAITPSVSSSSSSSSPRPLASPLGDSSFFSAPGRADAGAAAPAAPSSSSSSSAVRSIAATTRGGDEGGSRSGAGGRSTFAVSVARSSAPPSEALFVLWFWFPSAVSTRAVVARALDAAPWTSDLTRGDISTPGPRRSAWQARERASRASVCRGSRGAFFKQEGGLAAAKRRRKGRLPLRTQIAIR